METNNLVDSALESGQEDSGPKCTLETCELAVHKLATDTRISVAVKVLRELCPLCAQKLEKLLTTDGIPR